MAAYVVYYVCVWAACEESSKAVLVLVLTHRNHVASQHKYRQLFFAAHVFTLTNSSAFMSVRR